MEFLYRFATALAGFVLVIGPAVFFHELGHFAFAKKFGIKVFTFSLGFGPKIWSRTWGGTEYCLSAIPFGGYVKMAGEDPAEPRVGAPDEFASKPVWQRAIVIVAGPVANLILGYLICIFIFMVGVETQGFLPKIGIIAEGSPAAGVLQVGDVVKTVNGQAVSTWNDIELFERSSVDKPLRMEILRRSPDDGSIIKKEVEVTPIVATYPEGLPWLFKAQLKTDRYFMGGNGTLKIVPWVDPVLGRITEDGPADLAGLQLGDRVLSLNGKKIVQWEDLAIEIRSQPVGVPIKMSILRDGKEIEMSVVSKALHAQGPDGKIATFSAIGIQPQVMQVPKGLARSVVLSAFKTVELGDFIIVTLKRLLSGEVSARLLAGPLGIAQGSGIQMREGGLMQLVMFLALISVNLGVVNLLPFPLLDGGWLFIFLLYEALARKPMPQKVQERLMQGGIALLLALIVFITYNDLGRMIGFQTVDDVMKSKAVQTDTGLPPR